MKNIFLPILLLLLTSAPIVAQTTIYSENFGTTGGTAPMGWTRLPATVAANSNGWCYGTGAAEGTPAVPAITGITGQFAYITLNQTSKDYSYGANTLTTSRSTITSANIDARGFTNVRVTLKYGAVGEPNTAPPHYDYGRIGYLANGSTTDSMILLNNIIETPANNSATAPTLVTGTFPASGTALDNKQFKLFFYWINDGISLDVTDPPFAIDDIVVTGNAVVLPVELVSLEAKPLNATQHQIKWQSATESLVESYTLSASEDGIRFSPIATLKAQNKNGANYEYSHIFNNDTPNGTIYYQLSNKDLDGMEKILGLRSLQINDEKPSVVIFPNPSNGTFMAKIRGTKGMYNVKVINPLGQMINNYQVGVDADLPIDVSAAASGTYQIIVSDGKHFYQHQVVTKL